MQYTVRDVSKELDRALRRKAKAAGKSLNATLLEALEQSAGISDKPVKHRDLDWFFGTWVEDPAFDEAIAEFEQIDPEDWK